VYEEDLLTDNKRGSIRISQNILSVLGVVTHSWQRDNMLSSRAREKLAYLVSAHKVSLL
jgi:translation initiation factor 2B subunit (eIF-2B alpha/beta/delta family)